MRPGDHASGEDRLMHIGLVFWMDTNNPWLQHTSRLIQLCGSRFVVSGCRRLSIGVNTMMRALYSQTCSELDVDTP